MVYEAKFVKGNTKVGSGIWCYNKLAGSGVIAGCKGTCGKYCKGCYNPTDPKKSPCYVFKSYVQYGWENGSVVKSHIRNTEIMRKNPDEAFRQLQAQLRNTKQKPVAVRIHSSGELETEYELKLWIALALSNPKIPFYLYTKNEIVLDHVLSERSKSTKGYPILPANMFVNVSVWHENGVAIFDKWKHLENVRAFVYDDGYDYGDRLKYDCHCPAYDSKGKLNHDSPCEKCKICFQSKAKVCACYDH